MHAHAHAHAHAPATTPHAYLHLLTPPPLARASSPRAPLFSLSLQNRMGIFADLPANTILVDTSERRLYFGLGNGKALKYGVGVGRDDRLHGVLLDLVRDAVRLDERAAEAAEPRVE